MIPSLVEQVIAARIPSYQATVHADRVNGQVEAILNHARLTGHITAEGASRLLGMSERVARERLALAVERGAMTTWRTSQGKRFWGLL